MDESYTGEVEPSGSQLPGEQKQVIDVNDWIKKFHSSEKNMKNNFMWKYKLAKRRIRAENEVRSRNSYKMTHFNVPLAYSIGSNFVNSVYFKSPECSLTAREEVDHAKIENTEIAINDWLKDKKVKKTVRRCIWDAYSSGFGMRFIDHVYDDTEGDQVMGYEPEETQDPITGQTMITQKPIMNRIVLENKIEIQRIRPDMVRFPKGFDFDNYQDSPWIGFNVLMPIEEARTHKEWDADVMGRLQGEDYEKLSDKEAEIKQEGETNQKYVKMSYCFTKPENAMQPMTLMVFNDRIKDKALLTSPWDKGTVGYPLKPIYFNPLDDDNSYPNGDCWNMESQMSAIDTWWKKCVRHVERSNPKRIYDGSAIDTAEANNLKGNNDLEWVSVKNKDRRDIRTFVTDNNAPELPMAVDKLYATARQILDQIGPKSGMVQGSPDPNSKPNTATEAKIIATGDMIDIEARLDDVHDFIVDIVLDVAGVMEKSLLKGIPVKKTIQNPMGGQQEVVQEVNKDGFTGKINVDVEVESMQAQNKDVFRKQLIDAIGLFSNMQGMFQQLNMGINPKFWIERLMETMHIRNIEDGFVQLPPPVLGQVPPGASAPQGTSPTAPPSGAMEPSQVPEAGIMGAAQQV